MHQQQIKLLNIQKLNKYNYISKIVTQGTSNPMSVRFIGYESYVPVTPGNYAKGTTKIIKVSSPPDEQQVKALKASRYKEELDKQIEEIKRRKQETKRKEMEEDMKRQRDFYESLQHSNRKSNANHYPSHNNNINYHYHEHQGYSLPRQSKQAIQENDDEDTFHFQSRMAHIGKRKIKLDVPVFQSSSELMNQEQYRDSGDKRRKNFIDEMDRSLLDAFMAIQRSKSQYSTVVDEIDRVRKRLKTQESKPISNISNQQQNPYYSLPYQNHLSNTPYKLKKREITWA